MNVDVIINLLKSINLTQEQRNLLGQSTFYYCCGKDITPIIAFGDSCPLYVYVDLMLYSDFFQEKENLYTRLCQQGYDMLESIVVEDCIRIKSANNCELSCWRSKSGNDFCLIYIEADSEKTFRSFYEDNDKSNYIMPQCICNYKYEDSSEWLLSISKRVQLILGHCYDKKHTFVQEFPYYGDYGNQNDNVKLYKRFWYYAF